MEKWVACAALDSKAWMLGSSSEVDRKNPGGINQEHCIMCYEKSTESFNTAISMNAVNEFQHKLLSQFLLLLMHTIGMEILHG